MLCQIDRNKDDVSGHCGKEGDKAALFFRRSVRVIHLKHAALEQSRETISARIKVRAQNGGLLTAIAQGFQWRSIQHTERYVSWCLIPSTSWKAK